MTWYEPPAGMSSHRNSPFGVERGLVDGDPTVEPFRWDEQRDPNAAGRLPAIRIDEPAGHRRGRAERHGKLRVRLGAVPGDVQQGADLPIAMLDQDRPRSALDEPDDPHGALAVEIGVAVILQVREPALDVGIRHRRPAFVDDADEERSPCVEREVARERAGPFRDVDLLQALVEFREDVVIGQKLPRSAPRLDRFGPDADPVRPVVGSP